MLISWTVNITVGALLGTLSSLGIGGGTLLMLWLTMVAGIQHDEARLINLMFFLPAASITCIIRTKQRNIMWNRSLPAIIAGCTASLLFSAVNNFLPVELLRKLFGIMLLVIGIKELKYKKVRET